MSKFPRVTPYTPVFPNSIPKPDSPCRASTSCDSSVTSSDIDALKKTPKSYIDVIKERYILLATLPEELCPPSREASPETESRVDGLMLRMRKARELRFPHIPEFTLGCSGVRGGDWVGESASDDEQGEREYIAELPDVEEEWFKWERKKKAADEKRREELEAAEKIAKWSEEIKDATTARRGKQPQEGRRAVGISALGFPVVKRVNINDTKETAKTSHYFASQPPPPRDLSEPVDRACSLIPPAPALDSIPNFSDSFSLPDSPPSLPHDPSHPSIPEDVPPTPSFSKEEIHTSTPHAREPVLQLSSPVSPPRSLRPLMPSQILPSARHKRPHEGLGLGHDMSNEPSTPRPIKKARPIVEPITPASISRPSASQAQVPSQCVKGLPTLTALLAASAKRPSPRAKSKVTSSPLAAPVQELSPSQPSYAMFRPQYQSTQLRATSLPPSPSRPMTSTQPLSPQKTFGGFGSASSGMGFYHSQFNLEGKIDEVTAFLNTDVYEIET